MSRFAPVLLIAVVLIASGLSGCGGEGGTPATPPDSLTTQQVYILDFVHNTVTTAVQPQFVERNPGDTNAQLKLTITLALQDPGNPGRRQLNLQIQSAASGAVGANDSGVVTGIDVCFVNTVFQNASALRVLGGGFWGYDALNPRDGSPVYHLAQSLANGGKSAIKFADLILPPTATTAVVTAIIRADTQRGNPPALSHWYLTTLAGDSANYGYGDGPAGQALFAGVTSLLCREDRGDLLIADGGNNRIRRLYQGQVTTFAGNGSIAVLNHPSGLGRDPDGNVYSVELYGRCVGLTPPTGGTPTVIAGLRGIPGDVSYTTGSSARFGDLTALVVTGNCVYVCDGANNAVKLLTYNGTGSRFDPASWYVTDVTNGASFSTPRGLAVDALGNLYLVSSANQLFILPKGATDWTAIAGSGAYSETNGTGLSAAFAAPRGIAVDQAGFLYIADLAAALRRVRSKGGALTDPNNWVVETLVPSGPAVDGFTGTGQVKDLQSVNCARDGTVYVVQTTQIRRLDRTRS